MTTQATQLRWPTIDDLVQLVDEEFNHTGSNINQAADVIAEKIEAFMESEIEAGESYDQCKARILAGEVPSWLIVSPSGTLFPSDELLDECSSECEGCGYRVCGEVASHQTDCGTYRCSEQKGWTASRLVRYQGNN